MAAVRPAGPPPTIRQSSMSARAPDCSPKRGGERYLPISFPPCLEGHACGGNRARRRLRKSPNGRRSSSRQDAALAATWIFPALHDFRDWRRGHLCARHLNASPALSAILLMALIGRILMNISLPSLLGKVFPGWGPAVGRLRVRVGSRPLRASVGRGDRRHLVGHRAPRKRRLF